MKASSGTAAGLIVGDNSDSKDLITMTRGGPRVDDTEKSFSIPVVAVLKKTYIAIEEAAAKQEKDLLVMFDFPHWEDREKEYDIRVAIETGTKVEDKALFWHNLAIALTNQGHSRHTEAISALDSSIGVKPSLEAYDMLADLHRNRHPNPDWVQAAHTMCRAAAHTRAEALKRLKRDTKSGEFRRRAEQLYASAAEAGLPENKGKHVCDALQEAEEEAAHEDL